MPFRGVILILLIGCVIAMVFRHRIYSITQRFLMSDEEIRRNFEKENKENKDE